ncbi:MAG: hypothetical protein Kow0090_00910 [Myxococcota bacterium]
MVKRILAALLLTALIVYASPSFAQKANSSDARIRVLNIMKAELNRSKNELKLEDYEQPYFIAYQIKHLRSYDITSEGGAIHNSDKSDRAKIYLELRVGDYEFDNTATMSGGGFSFDFGGFFGASSAPIEENEVALRQALWLLTDDAYKKALSTFHKKKGQKVYETDDDKPPSFTKEKAQKFVGGKEKFEFDKTYYEEVARELSALFNEYDEIIEANVRIGADHETRYFVNTEGSEIITEQTLYGIIVSAKTRAEDGMLLTNDRSYYGRKPSQIPPLDELKKDIKLLIDELLALRKAEVLDPYTGPAILMPEAAGVLFHEAVGHRLEGERQNDDREGRTFKDQLGKKVLPEFIDLVDDPSLAFWEETPLNGYYLFDEEGVRGEKTLLIEKGILKNYLLSRTPVKGFKRSNGHGRASEANKPTGRMATTIVTSHKRVAFEKLKEKLIEEIKKQKKPYGLIFKDIVGGSTNTSSFGYQAFKGVPRRVYKIFPDGREELVRGVEMVGTPLSSINKIIVTSDKSKVFNGFCGAESGFIPVSAIAPAVLLKEIELQRSPKEAEKPPILPKPGSNAEKEGKKKEVKAK